MFRVCCCFHTFSCLLSLPISIPIRSFVVCFVPAFFEVWIGRNRSLAISLAVRFLFAFFLRFCLCASAAYFASSTQASRCGDLISLSSPVVTFRSRLFDLDGDSHRSEQIIIHLHCLNCVQQLYRRTTCFNPRK